MLVFKNWRTEIAIRSLQMRQLLLLLIFLLLPGFAFSITLKSEQLDAFVQRDGSVRLDYTFELFNESDVPYGSFLVSLPTTTLDVQAVRAHRCDAASGTQVELGVQLEQEGNVGSAVPVTADSSDGLFDLTVNLRDEPLMPGQSARICVIVPLPGYVREDWECSKTAYVSVRPSIFFSDQAGDLFVAIHMPQGVDPRLVLGQQEWPQEEIQFFLPVHEENGHPVVRWVGNTKNIHGLYWIAALFPADGMPLEAKFDGLQTDVRVVPKEIVNADVFIQEDGLVRVVYEMEIDNSGSCRAVDSVQFVLTGKPRSVSAEQDGKSIPIEPSPDIIDRMEAHLGNKWYQAYDASLKTPIASGKTGIIRVEALLEDEIELVDAQGGAMVAFGVMATAKGYWQPGSRWTTRIHLPAGTTALETKPESPEFPLNENVEGHTSFLWEHTKAPEEVQVIFPLGKIQGAQWSIKEPKHWSFVLKNMRQYPKVRTTLAVAGFFLCVIVATKLANYFRRNR